MREITIYTIRGEKIQTQVEDYNPQAIFEQLNQTDAGTDASRMIIIGEVIISRTDVARIVPTPSK